MSFPKAAALRGAWGRNIDPDQQKKRGRPGTMWAGIHTEHRCPLGHLWALCGLTVTWMASTAQPVKHKGIRAQITSRIRVWGDFPGCLQLCAPNAVAWVQSLVRELRSSKLCDPKEKRMWSCLFSLWDFLYWAQTYFHPTCNHWSEFYPLRPSRVSVIFFPWNNSFNWRAFFFG